MTWARTPDAKKPEPLVRDTPTERRCLKCGRRFTSTWAGHRLCAKCSAENETERVPRYRHWGL
jgi:Zn finger protein HypA/HybF involved in hydrogenase expression